MRSARVLLVAVLLASALARAQTPSAEVKKFLSFDERTVALTHVRVVDGTGAPAQDDRTVVIADGRIQAIGDASAPVPGGARVIDASGRTVLPGLIGMHDHLMYTASLNVDRDGRIPPPGGLVAELAFSAPRLYLASGVTTIRTTGSIEPYTDLNLRRKIDALEMPGPRIDVTGPYLEGKGSFFPQMANVVDAEQARRTVAYWVGEGVTSFKAYMQITEEALAAAIAEAHKRGAKVTGHLCAVDWRRAAAIGIDNLEHGPVFTDTEFVPNRKPDTCPSFLDIMASWEALDVEGEQVRALIADLVAHNVAVTSTLPVFEALIGTRPLLSARQKELLAPESLKSYLNARAFAATLRGRAERLEAALKKEMAFELAFARAGGLLLAGADPTGNGGALPGFADQRGLELLVEAGFTPTQAIAIATANGARFLGHLDRIGTIAPGKAADLVVVRGDPSRRIEDIENVEIVFKDGYAYDPAKLIESVRGIVGTL